MPAPTAQNQQVVLVISECAYRDIVNVSRSSHDLLELFHDPHPTFAT